MESTKNSDIRVNNRKRVLNTLFREGAMTKQALADRLEISLPTATLLLKELMEKGMVKKGETLDSTGGRKPVCMTPVYTVRYSVGIEVSMHEIRMACIDLGVNLVAKASYPYGMENTREYWEKVNRLLKEFVDEYVDDREKLLDVGLTLQISMDHNGAIWKKDVPEERRLDLRMAESCFDYPVVVRNSAKMAAIAQTWNKTNDHTQMFVFLTIGSYVGGAIVYNSEVLGFEDLNGQFGAMICGGKRFDENGTTLALCEKAEVSNMDELFEKMEQGDEGCRRVWEDFLSMLVELLHNLHCVFGWKIVIGGAICPYLEKYKYEVDRKLRRMSDYDQPNDPYVTISDLGAHGAAIGAAMMLVDHFLMDSYNG